MKMLIVDDNKSITTAIEKYLKNQGHEVSVCNEGQKGLELIQHYSWDRILLDLSMPEFGGLEIIENLENEQILKNKRIIVFTAASIPEYVVDKLLAKEGIVGLLRKPLSLVHLVDALSA